MTISVQRILRRLLVSVMCQCACDTFAGPQAAATATTPVPLATRATVDVPPAPPLPKSPVDSFRELLTMKPAEREQYFTNRPPQVREQLEQKIHEYEAMTPDVREARLRATQLHWYLSRFIPVPASNATFQLSAVPDGYRAFVSNRLSQFQLLPPALRQDVLAHPTTAGYFLGRAATNAAGAPPPPPALPAPLATIGKLTAEQREKLFSNFARFFDLPAEQKQVVLARLAPADRSRVQAVLAAIERLPADQRVRGLQSISLLFTMTDDQQRELLRSAARWKELPPAERQAWTNLVHRLPPLPELPSHAPRGSSPVATN